MRNIGGGGARGGGGVTDHRVACMVKFGYRPSDRIGGHTIEYLAEDHGKNADGSHSSWSGHLSGYESPESFEVEMARGRYADMEFPDGCPVIDARAEYEAHPGMAYQSPMVTGGRTSRFREIPNVADSLVLQAFGSEEASPEQRTMEGLARASLAVPEFSGMDMVTPAEYVAWWRGHDHGLARYGAFKDRKVVWE